MANLATSEKTLEQKAINTIRTLAMDTVEKANSGHPGTPMALAPLGYLLWTQFMKHNPKNPGWVDRDRFILSAGHASMLLYALLYLTGYEVTLDDLKKFRQWGSITPGHPEYGLTPGVETTTGPLGQGLMTAVGMVMAEAHLAALFNRPNHKIVDHHTYVICSDGDLMEGASHEAGSLAGHHGLGKLIAFYDDNHISIEGETEITYSDDVEKRFSAYNWHVQDLGENANDLEALSQAIIEAREEESKPSLIIIRSQIGYGAPNKQETPEAHGSPLGEVEVKKAKQFYGWPRENKKFWVPEEVLHHMRQAKEKGERLEKEWQTKLSAYTEHHHRLSKKFTHYLYRRPHKNWDTNIKHFKPSQGPKATRSAAGEVLNQFAEEVPWLIGGSADLKPSTKTFIKESGYLEEGNYQNRNIAWGVREHVMAAAASGITLHGGLRVFASTFLVFTDYARPAIRLAALMKLPVIYIMTHDSIGLGEDGPTHQPIEHLASLRAMPNLTLIRPADAEETAYAWRAAMARETGPTMLVLSRQKLPIFDRRKVEGAEGVFKGAYILSREKGEKPDLILIASGSEVHLILEAQEKLETEGVDARVVSMPSWELFKEQPQSYQNEVFPFLVNAYIAVEAGSKFGWNEWILDKGAILGIDRFGASSPCADNFKQFGFTTENIVKRSKEILRRCHE